MKEVIYVTLFFGGNVNGVIGTGVTETITQSGKVRAFAFDGVDGNGPDGILVDTQRNLGFGITSFPLKSFNGNVYQINREGKETILHTFCQAGCSDGQYPVGGLLEDAAGTLYGTTNSGGENGVGVVFEITP
jgi:uncharacterized repeat protein (TIGR03803 family)